MSHQPPPSSQTGSATAAATVSDSARSPRRDHSLLPDVQAEDAALLDQSTRHHDPTALSAHTTSVESAEDAAWRKRARSEANSRQGTEDGMHAFHPPPPPPGKTIAAAEDSSSTDSHAAMTPKRDGWDGASPRPDGPPSVTFTQQRHEGVHAASVALQKAASDVKAAEAEVLELEATRDALRCKAHRLPLEAKLSLFLERLTWMDSAGKAMLWTVAQSTYDSVSVEEAKVALREAAVELNKAKEELKEAKEERGNAEVKLEKAKAALVKAKTELSIAELADRVLTALSSGQLRIASLSGGAIGEAQGMTELVEDLTRKVPGLDSIDVLQRTVAFVLRISSGVGKTFFSLAAAKLLSESLRRLARSLRRKARSLQHKKVKVGTLYLGFNSGVPLQPNERDFLQQVPSYESVQLVLLRRLLIQLECLVAWRRQRGSPEPFTFDKYGLQHTVRMDKVDPSKAFLESLPLLVKGLPSIQEATNKALKLLGAVQEKYHLSHLMLVIDEGQILDELIEPETAHRKGGARYALRWTRELQLAACKHNCGLVCFGLMTGIDPDTWLSTVTEGTNYELSNMPMTRADFKKLTEIALTQRKRKIGAMFPTDETQIDLVAASYFPDARALSSINVDLRGAVPLPTYQYDRKCFDEELCRKLVIGAFAGLPIDSTAWERTIPSAWTKDGRRFPCPSYAMTVGLLKNIHSTLPTNNLTVKDCFEFEAFAAETLQLLIWVRGETSLLVRTPGSGLIEAYVTARMFPLDDVRTKMNEAFPNTMKRCEPIEPTDSKLMHYPSSKPLSHKTAFSVGTDSPPLADKFKKYTDAFSGDDNRDTLFLRCRGSAPIDFLILHKKNKSEWLLTLADAKHTSKMDADKGGVEKDMASKGDMLFRYVAYRLNSVTVTWGRTVLLISNASQHPPVREVRPPPPDEDPEHHPEPVTIVWLTPSTFKMGSVTEYLFAHPAAS